MNIYAHLSPTFTPPSWLYAYLPTITLIGAIAAALFILGPSFTQKRRLSGLGWATMCVSLMSTVAFIWARQTEMQQIFENAPSAVMDDFGNRVITFGFLAYAVPALMFAVLAFAAARSRRPSADVLKGFLATLVFMVPLVVFPLQTLRHEARVQVYADVMSRRVEIPNRQSPGLPREEALFNAHLDESSVPDVTLLVAPDVQDDLRAVWERQVGPIANVLRGFVSETPRAPEVIEDQQIAVLIFKAETYNAPLLIHCHYAGGTLRKAANMFGAELSGVPFAGTLCPSTPPASAELIGSDLLEVLGGVPSQRARALFDAPAEG